MVRARLFLILIAPIAAFCQNVTPRICGGVLINHSDYKIFFDKISGVPESEVYEAARRAMDLSDEQTRRVVAIASDLATLSCTIDKTIRPLMWEARMQLTASDSIDPKLQEKIHGLQAEWDRAVTEHIEQLKSTLGPARFNALDQAVKAPKPPPSEPRPHRVNPASGHLLY